MKLKSFTAGCSVETGEWLNPMDRKVIRHARLMPLLPLAAAVYSRCPGQHSRAHKKPLSLDRSVEKGTRDVSRGSVC